MKEQERKYTNRVLIAGVVILLITVGVLLWLILGPLSHRERIPTGRVDEFDIRIGVICKSKDDPNCFSDDDDFIPDITPGGRRSNNGEEKTVNGKTDTDIDREGVVYIDDKNGWYIYQKTLKIFENAAFEFTSKIAPGVSNSYVFKVHNETSNAIRYNIEFLESSEYAINMRYRLKRGDEYIVGSDSEWVGASELISAVKVLPMDGVDSYTLDWEWPYEDNHDALDTKAGEKMASEYGLEIKISFEEA